MAKVKVWNGMFLRLDLDACGGYQNMSRSECCIKIVLNKWNKVYGCDDYVGNKLRWRFASFYKFALHYVPIFLTKHWKNWVSNSDSAPSQVSSLAGLINRIKIL